MSEDTTNVIPMNSFKTIEKIIEERCRTTKIVVAYIGEDGSCSSFISDDCSDKDLCWMADTINERRRNR